MMSGAKANQPSILPKLGGYCHTITLYWQKVAVIRLDVAIHPCTGVPVLVSTNLSLDTVKVPKKFSPNDYGSTHTKKNTNSPCKTFMMV